MITFGTYRLPPEVAASMTKVAMLAGITRIDTAQLYGNESEVYNAVVGNPEIHITTKIHRKLIKQSDKDNRAIENSVGINASQVLLHSPENNFYIAWQQLSRLHSRGISVGVSNFDVKHLMQLEACEIRPSSNQIEATPFNLCSETVAYCRANGITIEAHSVLAKGELLDSCELNKLAKVYGLTPAQLMIQWSLDQGFVPIFSSKNPDHIMSIATMPKNSCAIDIPIEWNIGYRTHPQYTIS